jgi:hypothetical protein
MYFFRAGIEAIITYKMFMLRRNVRCELCNKIGCREKLNILECRFTPH